MTNSSNDDFEEFFQRKIVLYGAGITGVEIQKVLTRHFEGVDVVGFCDSYKTGRMNGLPIVSPHELKVMCEQDSPIVVITALSTNHDEIAQSLRRWGNANHWVYSLSEFERLILDHLDDNRIDRWYRAIKRGKSKLPKDERRNLYLNWWCPEHYCKNDILVYQPGKVGSSSVCNSLAAVGIGVTHVHMLTDSFIYDLVPESSWTPQSNELAIIKELSRYCIDEIQTADPLKIITLVREPISRDFSQFMYHLGELAKHGYPISAEALSQTCAEGITRRATQNGKCRFGYQFEWFNIELRDVFGVDVYQHAFDREQGYGVAINKNVQVLTLKLERLNSLGAVISNFVGIDDFTLINANESRKKNYYNLYSKLRGDVVIPPDVVDLYYKDNPLMDHFYGAREKAEYLSQWRVGGR